MKLITLIALLSIAGCGDLVQTDKPQTDGRGGNQFTFTQEFGYCDTVCIGESIVLGDFTLPYSEECFVESIATIDTVHNGLYQYAFMFQYNTSNAVSVNFGNGTTKSFNGSGIEVIKYFCNQNYEVIICYE